MNVNVIVLTKSENFRTTDDNTTIVYHCPEKDFIRHCPIYVDIGVKDSQHNWRYFSFSSKPCKSFFCFSKEEQKTYRQETLADYKRIDESKFSSCVKLFEVFKPFKKH